MAEGTEGDPIDRSAAIVCATCGRAAPGTRGGSSGVPLTWMSSLERGRPEYTCAECSRANLRSIEGRLDRAWW